MLAVAAGAITGCGDGGGEAAALPDIPAGSLLLPPASAGDLRRTDLQMAEEYVLPRADTVSAVRVERADGGVVVALLRDRAELEEGWGDEFFGSGPGPVIGLGRATPGFSDLGTSVMWPASDGLVIELASRDLSEDQLVGLASRVTLADDGSPVLPAEPIGEISGALERPLPGMAASYAENGYDHVMIHAATPQVQRAYEALLIDSPEDDESVRTADSCCLDAIYEPRRTLDVGDREAVAGTITPYLRVLIVPGDPGIVVVGTGTLANGDLAAIAAGAEPATVDEVAAVVEDQRTAESDRLVETVTEHEESLGYEVLHRWDDEDGPAVLTFGTAPRPEPEAPDPGQPTLCAVPATDSYNASCLTAMPPDVVVAAPYTMSAVRWGLVADGVAAVRYEFPEGEIPTTLTEVDVPGDAGPTRVFHALVTMEEEIDLMADMSPEDFAAVALVATDDQGRELARRPVFPDAGPGPA